MVIAGSSFPTLRDDDFGKVYCWAQGMICCRRRHGTHPGAGRPWASPVEGESGAGAIALEDADGDGSTFGLVHNHGGTRGKTSHGYL